MDTVKLGILGLGSQTTAYYISELNRLFNAKNGGYSTCPFILWNVNFDAINSRLPSISTEVNDLMQQYIKEIEKFDITDILIPNITLHESVDQIEIQKNILHPIYLTVSKIKDKKLSKIVLMGSEHTMSSPYIHSIFNSNGIAIEIPTAEDRLQIDTFRKQVYAQKASQEQIANYHTIIEKYTAKNPVVLAFTELSIFKPKQYINLIDMVEVQLTEAITKL